MSRAPAGGRCFTEVANQRAVTLSIFAERLLLRGMTLSRRWTRPAGKSKKAVFDAKPSFFGGVTLSQKPKSSSSCREIPAFLMSLIRKICGLRKYLMSCGSEIHGLRKRHNVTAPEICCSVRKLKKSNGTGRGISLVCEKTGNAAPAIYALPRDFHGL